MLDESNRAARKFSTKREQSMPLWQNRVAQPGQLPIEVFAVRNPRQLHLSVTNTALLKPPAYQCPSIINTFWGTRSELPVPHDHRLEPTLAKRISDRRCSHDGVQTTVASDIVDALIPLKGIRRMGERAIHRDEMTCVDNDRTGPRPENHNAVCRHVSPTSPTGSPSPAPRNPGSQRVMSSAEPPGWPKNGTFEKSSA